jgi:prepilin-type N-terminal cleavage/methylation domain-containing protein
MRNPKGFSLVEIMFALFVGVLLLSAIYAATTTGQRSTMAVERKVAAQQDVRAALQVLGLELSMASFNPTFAVSPWRNGADCALAASQTNKGIQEATANAITLEMDLGESFQVGDDENEILRYQYDAVNQRITRERILCSGGYSTSGPVDFLGADPASGQPRTVRVINETLGIPVFGYFNSQGVATTNIPEIRRIDITLAVETSEAEPGSGRRRQMIYSSSVIPRNHAISQ